MDQIEYRLGQLDGGLKALIAEVRGLRADHLRAFEQHDLRDDERFASHSARLVAIEQQIGRHGAELEADTRASDRQHERRNLIHVAVIGFLGAVIGALVIAMGPLIAHL